MEAERNVSPADGAASSAASAVQELDGPTTNAHLSPASTSTSRAQRALHVLTVGDGNFSYSLALAKQQHSAGSDTLTATSYDSYDELVAKYPESARICEQLKELGVRVLHRVDATNLRASLQASDSVGNDAVITFDRVVFNHPHCGEENVRRHQSLLSHFFTSALEIVGADGQVYLTLADGQSERWEALARAERAGLKLSEQVDDVDSHPEYGLSYERKRHQNGRSFHQVTLHGEKKRQASTLFVFARASELDNARTNNDTQTQDIATKVRSEVVATTNVASRKRKAEEKNKQKKQKKQQQQTLIETPSDLVCHECDKSFKSMQGLKTHIHMVHELQAAGTTAPGTALLSCDFCDRTFKSEDAQRQHRVAKHGKDQLIKPDWYDASGKAKAQESESSNGSAWRVVADGTSSEKTSMTCTICRLEYASQEEFDRHWTSLQPKKMNDLLCARCERSFGDERALRQHQNFCISSSNNAPQ